MTVSDPGSRVPVIGFLTGTGVSLFGNAMAMLAIPWFVLELTGSASQTGFAGMAASLPMALSGLLGGPLIDRFGGRRISIISDVISALSVAAIPLLYHLELLTYPLILALIFVGAILDIPGVTARRMLLPGFQKQANLRPEQMNTAFEVLGNIANMLGPAIAGGLIVLMGPVNLLWITSAGFLASAAGVLFLAPTHEQNTRTQRQPYLESIREGFAFIGNTRVLLTLAILFAGTNFLSNGFTAVGLPVLVFETWGTATRLGLFFTAMGVGSLLGALLYGSLGHRVRQHRRTIVLVGFGTQPIWFGAFLLTESFPILLAAMFLSGFVAGPINPLSVTVRFEHIPKQLQGRVFGTFSAITATITPIGIGVSGLAIEHFGLDTTILIIALAYAAMAGALPFVAALRQLDSAGPFTDEETG